MLTKLSEVLFVELFRRYLRQLLEGQTGWLAGAREPAVGKVLAFLREPHAEACAVATIARETGYHARCSRIASASSLACPPRGISPAQARNPGDREAWSRGSIGWMSSFAAKLNIQPMRSRNSDGLDADQGSLEVLVRDSVLAGAKFYGAHLLRPQNLDENS